MAQQKAKKPNIIYVMADQLRHDMMGYSGNYKAITPNLDKMATEGLNFENCVSVTPVCAPHRASLLTGKYSSSTGMVTNEIRINPNQKTIGHVLTDNGYETGYIGKWHLWANIAGHHGELRTAYIPPGPYRLGFDGYWAAYNFNHRSYQGYFFEDTEERKTYDKPYEPEAQFDMAMDFVEKKSKEEAPFALFLSVGVPHDPWVKDNVPEEFYDMFKDVAFKLPDNWQDSPDGYMDRNTDPEKWLSYWKENIPEQKRVYYAMVASLDVYMGRLMKKLKTLGIDEDTIVIFSSDHGEMFGENGRVFKLTFYESAARIPLLVRWPGKIPAGLISDAPINTPDLMPTMLGLANLPIPESVEGMDLSAICLGKNGKEPDFAFLQGMGHTYLWKDGHEWRALRSKRFTYAKYLVDGSELLFDNLKDPQQTKNLVNDPFYADVYADMKQKMMAKMNMLNDEFKPMSWYRDNWLDGNRNIIKSAKGAF
ncbi:sulfatase [Maribacter sp. 2307ULW6-5]|uniref:sulfatase family protein n=1 Tax=Maribacter sp. 2307ULW6-5 TaxID=3386275 RepID=UPI0039BD9308